ncbi:hypothetical protein [Pseudoroseomonas ludipueritiae]|uniref:DUF5666 domain-containing protein n=1 Tax=Pseudoroseomonas ludipueritiae TaxID=198093 RepID=A0ABR7RB31_9PROT|nr:hypothetical protein [Pseudoroseomonas ludipueritiae]MBC9179005.1 hypothetical protein [Pseudoroseomonas ludipueritiae]
MKRRMLLALAGGLSLQAGLARAQAPAAQRVRLRGRIDSISAERMEVTLPDGGKASASLPANLRVTELMPVKLSDIREDSYVGVAAMRQPDGALRAVQVMVFPASSRGVGEGHYPWVMGEGSTMTNGTVGSMTTGTVGRVGKGEDLVLTVRYKDGEQRILVPEDAAILTFTPASRDRLVPGTEIILNGTRAADGSIAAASINVGKDGVLPPN